MNGINNQCHLLGTQALLNEYKSERKLSKFQTALAWIGLRQELRIAILAQRPVQFPLDCFSHDLSSPPIDDGEWANRMVYILAEVQSSYCEGRIHSLAYNALVSKCQSWADSLPRSFAPIYARPATESNSFPRFDFLNDAVGTNYLLRCDFLTLHLTLQFQFHSNWPATLSYIQDFTRSPPPFS